MSLNIIMMLVLLAGIGVLAFGMSISIKNYDKKKAASKSKKGRNKYMPQVKTPGR